MKKILYFPTRYFPAISGAEFYIQRIAEILNLKYNYNVNIITSNALDFKSLRAVNGKLVDENNKYYNIVNNLKVNRYPINYSLSLDAKTQIVKELASSQKLFLDDTQIKYFLSNGPYLENLLKELEKFKQDSYDLIHTTFYPYFNLVITLLIGKITNKPTICTPFFHFSNPRYLNSAAVKILDKFDIIISCTSSEKEFLIKNFKISEHKIRVIPMGVDNKIFSASLHKDNHEYSFKQKYFRKKEKCYKMVLFCGYKNFEKGALSILKAIPLIVNKFRKVYFVFIGPSTIAFNRELSKLQKLRDYRIINLSPDNLKGYFDKKKIAAFQETDLYLMPSRSDAFGIAYLEAWASGKPVIGAKIGATPEVIRQDIDGFLVDFNNPIDISDKVIKLLKNKRLRHKLGNSGKEKIEKFFTWDIITKKTHELYQELITEWGKK
ncbi:MAG: glycosyltransferase family 1 protein [Candidatus Lokiarchaeota archaeon]|nr:glycosyltransferase family 1 protein [Candidatus Lokiarchaeota archaeon]